MRSTDVVESLYVMELAYAAPDRELDRQCPVGRSVGGTHYKDAVSVALTLVAV